MSYEADMYDELLAEACQLIARLRTMEPDIADEVWRDFGRELREWNERAREELGEPES